MSTCEHCQAATGPGQTLCIRHVTLLEKVLGNVRGHYGDLETLRTKRTRYGDAGKGSIGKTMPLGIDLRFAAVRTHVCEPTCSTPCPREGAVIEGQATAAEHAVRNLVTTWARIVLDAHPPVPGDACAGSCLHKACAVVRRSRHPQDNVPSVLGYLLGWVRWIATQEWADELLGELQDAETALSRLVDRPADRVFAGPCWTPIDADEHGHEIECGADLYAKVGAQEVQCDACGFIYNVDEVRAWLLREAEDRLLPAADLSRAVSWLGGQPLAADRIRQWKKRGKIHAYPERCEHCHTQPVVRPCPMDTPLYRVGDAIDLIAEQALSKGA